MPVSVRSISPSGDQRNELDALAEIIVRAQVLLNSVEAWIGSRRGDTLFLGGHNPTMT